MASQLYELAREKFLGGELDWSDDSAQNWKVYLIDEADYAYNFTTDEFADDIAVGAAKVATSGNLANLTNALGVANADDITFSAVSGDQSEALVIWQDTGTQSTSPLVLYLDDPEVTGLPITPNGGDITVQWDEGANKIFKLGD